VGVHVIVLNGGSSSGKSTLATALQQRLEGMWLSLGVDDLIRAISHGPDDTGAGGSIEFGSDGSVMVHERLRQAEKAWYAGLAAIARTGAGLIVDEVFLDAGLTQARLEAAFEGLIVLWVGVQCQPGIAEAREARRGDRTRGMARDQAERVHEGVRYDVVVDTTERSSAECAEAVVAVLSGTA
jgi:chloramphenicol 3-O phosphotransferase